MTELHGETDRVQTVFGNGQAGLAQTPQPGAAPTGPGVAGPMATGAGGLDGRFGNQVNVSTDRAGTVGQFGQGMEQTARAGADRLNAAGTVAPGAPGIGSGLDKAANAARMAPSDLMKAALNPYSTNNPLIKMVQGIPQIAAQAIPQVLNAPMQLLQGGFSPIQSMMGAPGAVSPVLTDMLSRAASSPSGMDGGPASLAIGSGATTEAGQRMQQIAQSVVGKFPYAWGGGGPDGPGRGISDGGGPGDAAGDPNKVGFDCSGLAQYVWKQMYGVVIPEVSQTQYSGGTAVSAAQAKPGDLVFPSYAFGSGGGPTHVQILMPGGQTVLEAPSSGQMVKISPLSSGAQFRTFSSAA